MNAGARAAQLVSQVSKNFFITAAQAAVQKPMDPENELSNPTYPVKCDDDSDDEAAGTAGGGDDEIYEVDQILQTRMQGRTRMFLVRWKNYGPEADSWEPMSMLMEGASEIVREFMEKYEKEKAAKKTIGKKRGRPPGSGSRRESSRSLSKMEDEPEPPTLESSESDNDDDDDDDGYGLKKKKRKKSKKEKKNKDTSTSEKKSIIPTPQRYTTVNRQTPWFMDSSSDSDSEKPEKKPSSTISNISTSSTANGQPSQKILIKTSSPVTPLNDNISSHRQDSEVKEDLKDEKKHKKDKHKKKHKKKLNFEGIFKSSEEILSFVAKSTEGNNETIILSHEEAIESDSRSLARFLINKIEFKPDGSFFVNGGSSSTRS